MTFACEGFSICLRNSQLSHRRNLQAARELGMTTIRKPLSFLPTQYHLVTIAQDVEIGKTLDAVRELEKLVAQDLTSPVSGSKLWYKFNCVRQSCLSIWHFNTRMKKDMVSFQAVHQASIKCLKRFIWCGRLILVIGTQLEQKRTTFIDCTLGERHTYEWNFHQHLPPEQGSHRKHLDTIWMKFFRGIESKYLPKLQQHPPWHPRSQNLRYIFWRPTRG